MHYMLKHTFNNISVTGISWLSILLVEETEKKTHQTVVGHWQVQSPEQRVSNLHNIEVFFVYFILKVVKFHIQHVFGRYRIFILYPHS